MSRALDSLQVPNYRRFFAGQVVSVSGTWMQIVAEMWLLVQLTDSGLGVGVAAGLQFLPILLLGAYGGVLADRLDKRRLLQVTQALSAVPPVVLAVLVATGAVEVWMVYALILLRGTVLALDNPARQAFVHELVGPDRVVNAVSLNSVIIHSARIVGPAVAGVILATGGTALCFALNGLSFGAMLVALRGMDVAALQTGARVPRRPGQVRDGVRQVGARPELRIPMVAMAVVGTLAFNFQVLLPLLARFTWEGTATTYALLTTAMGVGSVLGALVTGARGATGQRLIVGSAAAFGLTMLAAAAAPSVEVQLLVLLPLGVASVAFSAGVNATLQLRAGDALRGRVMALYSVVFLGSTPFGAPLIGWLAEVAGPRAGLVVGGVAALVTAVWAQVAYTRAAGRRGAAAGPAPAQPRWV